MIGRVRPVVGPDGGDGMVALPEAYALWMAYRTGGLPEKVGNIMEVIAWGQVIAAQALAWVQNG